jgi:hypothetical protein
MSRPSSTSGYLPLSTIQNDHQMPTETQEKRIGMWWHLITSSTSMALEISNSWSAEDRAHYCLFVVACITTIISSTVSVILYVGYNPFPELLSLSLPQGPLPRPNPYVRLQDALTETTHEFPPIHNFPEVVMQMRSSDESRRLWEDDRERSTPIGSIYPDDRHIVVTANVSTEHILATKSVINEFFVHL